MIDRMTGASERSEDMLVDQARLDRQWRAISQKLEDEGDASWWKSSVPLAAIAALAMLVFLFPARQGTESAHEASQQPRQLEPATETEVSAGPGQSVAIDGRARVYLDGDSRVDRVSSGTEGVRVRLQGSARFVVERRPSQVFEVWAQNVVVRVVGTSFTVSESLEGVDVFVQEGVVKVVVDGETTRLERGQRWSSAGSAEATDGPDVSPSPTASANAQSSGTQSRADRLFSKASQARLEGNTVLAARWFSEFAQQFPNDARASLASLEAARIQQDVLDDPEGALGALEEVASGREGELAEHALARKIEALTDLGRTKECQALQRDYLQRFPKGSHTGSVQSACSSAP